MNNWQPIETAPKNGAWLLLVRSVFIPVVAYWDSERGRWLSELEWEVSDETWEEFLMHEHYRPTHWMPLPKPPRPNGGENE